MGWVVREWPKRGIPSCECGRVPGQQTDVDAEVKSMVSCVPNKLCDFPIMGTRKGRTGWLSSSIVMLPARIPVRGRWPLHADVALGVWFWGCVESGSFSDDGLGTAKTTAGSVSSFCLPHE